MSDPINDGGPAFARSSQGPSGDLDMAFGMTLRDYFAAKAMLGVIGSTHGHKLNGQYLTTYAAVATWSYMQADAMLAEREKGKE